MLITVTMPAQAPDEKLRLKRNNVIRKDYTRYFNKGQRREVILPMLAEKYYLKVSTVEQIVTFQGRYKSERDL